MTKLIKSQDRLVCSRYNYYNHLLTERNRCVFSVNFLFYRGCQIALDFFSISAKIRRLTSISVQLLSCNMFQLLLCLSLKDLFFCQHFSKNEPQIDLSNSIGSKNALVAEIPQGHLELTNSCNVVKPSYHKLVNWVDFS